MKWHEIVNAAIESDDVEIGRVPLEDRLGDGLFIESSPKRILAHGRNEGDREAQKKLSRLPDAACARLNVEIVQEIWVASERHPALRDRFNKWQGKAITGADIVHELVSMIDDLAAEKGIDVHRNG